MPEEIQDNEAQEPAEDIDDETKQILKDLEKEGHEVAIPGEEKKIEEPKPEAEVPKPEEKKEEAKPEEVVPKPEGQKVDDAGEKGKEPKEPRYMPTWQHKIAEKNWEKEKTDLLDQIKTLQTNPSGPAPTQEQKQALGSVQETIDRLVEERGYDDGVKDLIADITKVIQAAQPGQVQLSPEQLEAINTFKTEAALLQTERLANHQETSFNAEFDEKVLPAIEMEYPGIPKETLAEIKADVKKKAFTEEYAKTDLAVIFKGMDEFRGRYTAPRKGPEDARGGEGRGDNTVLDFENMTEDQLSKLSGEDKDKYFAWVDKNKK